MTQRKNTPFINVRKSYTFHGNMLGDKELSESEIQSLLNPLGENEYEGEGLPPKPIPDNGHTVADNTYEIRVFHDKEGKLEVTYARKGSKKHTKLVFEGLTERQACDAKGVFERNISKVIVEACMNFAWACYERENDSREKRKEICDTILYCYGVRYKSTLLWERERIVEETEENGIKITTSVPIISGRNKGTKNLTPKITLNAIVETIKKFKGSYVFPTQSLVAKRLGVNQRTIQRCLKNADIKLKYNDYVHSLISS